MKSRCLLGLRYPGADSPLHLPLGVAIFESTEPTGIARDLQDQIEASTHWKTLQAFINSSPESLPLMSDALERGF